MDLFSHQFAVPASLPAALAIFLAGFILGRFTAARSDPARIEEKKRRARDYDAWLRKETSGLPRDLVDKICGHLAKGEKIQAVKAVRDALGHGLKESKDIVEHFEPRR